MTVSVSCVIMDREQKGAKTALKQYIASLAAVMLLCLTGCQTESSPAPVSEIPVTAETNPVSTETTALPSETTTVSSATETTTVSSETETTTIFSATETTAVTVTEITLPGTTETTAAPAEEETDWALRLVNPSHPIGDYAPPELVTLTNGVQIDARIYPPLQKMFDAMYAAGYSPYTREGYRTFEAQQDIMDTRIRMHLAEGYTEEGAKEQAEKYVAIPGTSEHQTGLAVDINSTDGNSWPLYGWLAQHAHEYGFILRYPQGAEEITGYQYEAWHFRYVGKEAAAEITQRGITLEEYLTQKEE